VPERSQAIDTLASALRRYSCAHACLEAAGHTLTRRIAQALTDDDVTAERNLQLIISRQASQQQFHFRTRQLAVQKRRQLVAQMFSH
jgi:hypothetical protein